MATTTPFPFIPMQTTSSLLEAFDGDIYDCSTSTTLYKYLDALVGSTGVGSLINQMFFTNLGNALETIYFNELDYIFGSMNFVARTAAESYPYNPGTDMLTSAQWDEVKIKDAWYRARIKDYFTAIQLGGTTDGIRECVKAAVAVDCNVFEVWRYIDNFGIKSALGRSPGGWTPGPAVSGNRNEVVVQPLKSSLEPGELRLCRDMLQRMVPVETIVTVDTEGLAVSTPITVNAACADSTYYEVQKVVTATPLISQLPPPEFLAIDLLPTEQWLFPVALIQFITAGPGVPIGGAWMVVVGGTGGVAGSGYAPLSSLPPGTPTRVWGAPDGETFSPGQTPPPSALVNPPVIAPYAAFNITSQYGYFYLIGGGARSPIDAVTYGTLNADGVTTTTAPNFAVFETAGSFTQWTPYDKADSPDNFPGGKFGRHPTFEPAEDPTGGDYHFPWLSQEIYIAARILEILGLGGDADDNHYRLPIQKPSMGKKVFYPQDAIAFSAPASGSTVTASITNKKGPQKPRGSWRNPSVFIRS